MLRLRATRVSAVDGVSVVGTVDDVTEAVGIERTLRSQATLDALTGVLHRSGLERTWETLPAAPYAVTFIDLDGFKQVNDVHGHDAGDRVLAAVGQRLQRAVRPIDLVCRYGGDEFVVVFTALQSVDDAAELADRVRAEVEGPLPLGVRGLRWDVRASVGTALGNAGEPFAAVVSRADASMYREKRQRSPRTKQAS